MILVVGATGYLGGIITRSLLQQGHPVRITLRPNSSYSDLIGLGAKAAHADLKDPDSLPAACKGIDVVITTANSARRGGSGTVAAVDLAGNRNLINAAREAGVRQFIFISAYEADLSHPVPFLQAKAQTEDTLRASGLCYDLGAARFHGCVDPDSRRKRASGKSPRSLDRERRTQAFIYCCGRRGIFRRCGRFFINTTCVEPKNFVRRSGAIFLGGHHLNYGSSAGQVYPG